jgi:transposase InsO family protein
MSVLFGKCDQAGKSGGPFVSLVKGAPQELTVETLENDLLVTLEMDNRRYLEVKIFDFKVLGMLDSGANITVLGKDSLNLIRELELEIHETTKKIKVKTADGNPHQVSGVVYLPFSFNNKTEVMCTYVVPSLSQRLYLGMDFWTRFDINITIGVESLKIFEADESGENDQDLNEHSHKLSVQQQNQLAECVSLFKGAVPGQIGQTDVLTYTIDTGDSPPIRSRPHPMSPYIEKEVTVEIERMISLGVIERSNSAWGHPIVPVRKSSGKLRLCLDSRKLNAVTIKDPYPLPHLRRILGRLEKSTFLSTVDLSDAFWQIPLDQSSREKTAFIVPCRGLYQFTRLPFGLKNSPMALARCMDKVLDQAWEPNVFVYLDDIVICSETFEEHLAWIKKVADRLSEANLTINTSKSKFAQKQIKYLGYILSGEGLRPDPAKVSGIVNYPVPTKIRDIRQFMGMANFYSRFIENFSHIIAPISDMLKGVKKGMPPKKLVWSSEANSAFEHIKSKLISAPILTSPNFELPFTLQTDSSDRAIGAVLTQEQNGVERVIAYYSQKLSSAQRKYAATERECLAVLMAIRHFRCYIEGVHFHVQTDCSAVTWIQNLKADGSNRLSRWAMELQMYDMTLAHKKGKLNVVPDALSRSLDEISTVTSQWYDQTREKVRENPENYPDFKIENNRLYKYVNRASNLGDYVYDWKLVIPSDRREEIMKSEHDSAAHQGYLKTANRIRLRYYWPKMLQDIKNYITNCETCKAAKPLTSNPTPPMGRQKLADHPWQLISADYLGPLTRSKKGNNFLLVVADWFSKEVLLFPCRAAESKSLVNMIEHGVFYTKGVPETIITDNGKQFISREFRDCLDRFSVKHWLNPSYHPQVNPSERVNKVIVSALKSFTGPDQTLWDQNIKKIETAIQTSVHDSTGFTPFFINHGREMPLSGSEHKILREIGKIDPVEAEKTRIDRFGKLNEQIKTNLKKAYETQSKYYNLRTRPQKKFAVGSVVWVKNHQQSKKANKYMAKLGPRFIKGVISDVKGQDTYEISGPKGKRMGIFHACDLKA